VKVPIRNIYYLLCYACAERIIDSGLEWTRAIDGPDSLPNLLAFVLMRRLKPLLRRGLDRSYLKTEEETAMPRGRVDFGSTLNRCTARRYRVICSWDELDVNVLHNQILRTTIHLLANHSRIETTRRLDLLRIDRMLHQIDVIRPSAEVFQRVQLHRNNSEYQFLMRICELIWLGLLPEPDELGSRSKFDAIRDDDRVMQRIFEDFIGNFYRLELSSVEVRTQHKLDWDAGENTDFNYLPVMRADALLRSKHSGRLLVIDAKYYRDALVSYYGNERVRSGHLYQLTAYLRSVQMRDAISDGLLIYPKSGAAVRATFCLSGRTIRVRTLDLSQPWREVDRSLRDLAAEAEVAGQFGKCFQPRPIADG
jgi:5-methylcytosine-specific restriction enzyme subunit McrC